MFLPLFVGVLCLVLVLLYITKCPFYFGNRINEEGIAVYFTLVVFLMPCDCECSVSVLWLSLAVPRVGLQCVILVFPDHTHLHFKLLFIHPR